MMTDAELVQQLARLMGWDWREGEYTVIDGIVYCPAANGWRPWHPLVNIGDAMDVFTRMNKGQPWEVWERFNTALGGMVPSDPEAICRAALHALSALPKEGG